MALTFQLASAIVESSFTPLSCRCSRDSSSASIRIYDAATGEPRLVVAGIDMRGLGTARGVSRLVDELQHELELAKLCRSDWTHGALPTKAEVQDDRLRACSSSKISPLADPGGCRVVLLGRSSSLRRPSHVSENR
jgi:hypothetical protein